MTTAGGPAPVAYFSEPLPGTDAPRLRLAAAVAWRGTPDRAAASGGRGPIGWLRRLRHQLWLRFGPLGADVHVRSRPLVGGTSVNTRGVTSIGLGPGGAATAYYDEGARVVRVLGRVYPVPPGGRTLVLLVDARGSRAAAPRVAVRTVSAPVVSVPLPPEWRPPPPGAVTRYMIGEHPAWAAALRADPAVRAFLDEGANL